RERSHAPPHGYSERVFVPRAAHSYSASVGSRTLSPLLIDAQRARAIASNQLMPTTGRFSPANFGSFHMNGCVRLVASRHAQPSGAQYTPLLYPSAALNWAYRPLVTA